MWSIQIVPWGHYFKQRLLLVTSRRFAYLTKPSSITSQFPCLTLQSVSYFESSAVSSPSPISPFSLVTQCNSSQFQHFCVFFTAFLITRMISRELWPRKPNPNPPEFFLWGTLKDEEHSLLSR